MESEEVLETIAHAIRSLQFGTLEIVIHDSRVVRIERRERIRLDVEPESNHQPNRTTEGKPSSNRLDRNSGKRVLEATSDE